MILVYGFTASAMGLYYSCFGLVLSLRRHVTFLKSKVRVFQKSLNTTEKSLVENFEGLAVAKGSAQNNPK